MNSNDTAVNPEMILFPHMVRPAQVPSRPERSDAATNRRRILDAACAVFASRGPDGEIREIAERAGVGVGTVYRHFQNREGLLAALLMQTKQDLLRRLQVAVQTERPDDALRAMIHAGAEVCEKFGALTEAILSGRLDSLHGGHAEFTALLLKALQRGIEEGSFRPDLDVPVVVAMLEAVFTSGTLVELASGRSYAGAADAISDFFLAAISSTATTDEPEGHHDQRERTAPDRQHPRAPGTL